MNMTIFLDIIIPLLNAHAFLIQKTLLVARFIHCRALTFFNDGSV